MKLFLVQILFSFMLLTLCQAGKLKEANFIKNLNLGKKQTVVTFGTSLTKVGAWVAQLDTVLNEQYLGKATVINGAQGGANSKWGCSALDEKVLKHNPDTVFIEFAINDAVESRGLSVRQSRKNLNEMIDRILKLNSECEIILMTMNIPVGHTGIVRPNINAYYQMYRDVAKERRFQLIDHVKVWGKLLSENPGTYLKYVPDGIHPMYEGALNIILPTISKSIGMKPGKPERSKGKPCWTYLFRMMDKLEERNDQVTKEEFEEFFSNIFKKHDVDGSGNLNENEYVPNVLFKHFDKDSNSQLTFSEYKNIYTPLFVKRDVNLDHKLTIEELFSPNVDQ